MSWLAIGVDISPDVGQSHTVVDAIRAFIDRSNSFYQAFERSSKFSAYYQLHRTGESSSSKTEPRKNTRKKELKSRYEGSHSLFGLIWQISSTTGWWPHRILWHIPYTTLMLMTADAPRMVDESAPPAKEKSTVGIFQTMLNAQNR